MVNYAMIQKVILKNKVGWQKIKTGNCQHAFLLPKNGYISWKEELI